MKVRVLLLSALLCAAPLAAQERGARRDADAGPAAFLLANRAALSLSAGQVTALQRLKDRSDAQNEELRAAIAADRDAVFEEERRSETSGAGARPAARSTVSPGARRTAARDAAMRLRANIAREANEARALLTEEQWKRLHSPAARP